MRQLIAGNWKMNGLRSTSEPLLKALHEGAPHALQNCDMLICPPATLIAQAASVLAGSGIEVGAQDCHRARSGAHTGDLSAEMLVEAGARWVILGHSERRRDHGELSETVREKVIAARQFGLTPIVCVGETEDERASGRETEIVGWQIKGSLPDGFAADSNGVIAYEPVWAIGTGRTATVEDVAMMHAFIREELVRQFGEAGRGVRILYGGSVKPENAASLLRVPEVGGALVGGASLSAQDFLAIAAASA
ncbi:Triosephosphate isomerase [Granulibacter bethesdensis]|uniref:Triosephosphate isomerase n=1 Tax=Granulibacter bethesdensis TaxID=364410 RepID=A0AAN0RD55_9PROT|nr:triose-phosphate isomerase [Granulibacter bethesdensis]AHJ62649.1 Triosephosphate isomerase [Granulibacter bethesdensis]